jgi:hypothetical protein
VSISVVQLFSLQSENGRRYILLSKNGKFSYDFALITLKKSSVQGLSLCRAQEAEMSRSLVKGDIRRS